MRKFFAEIFGQIADAIGNGVADVRDKLVFESFFGRHVPERNVDSDLGWFQDHPATAERQQGSVLDGFHDRLSPAERAAHFREPPEQDHGIER